MTTFKRAPILGTTAILVSVSLVGAAMGQTTAPAPSAPPSAAANPETNPPQVQNTQAVPQTPASRETAGSTVSSSLVGLAAVASDGTKLGAVQSVKPKADGKGAAIILKAGGFLGFGGHLVAIPEGKFTRSGDSVQVGMTAEQVSKLPATAE